MNDFTSTLVVGFSANDLPNKDIGSQNDTYVKFSTSDGQKFRTSVVKDDNNPSWTDRFNVKFQFERVIKCHVVVFDSDDVSADDKIGEASFNLSELACQKSLTLKLGKKGTITIFGEESAEAKELIELKMNCASIPKRGMFQGKNKPFIKICREIGSSTSCVFSSKPDNDTSFITTCASLSDRELYGADPTGAFTIELWDHHESKNDKRLASQRFNWTELYAEACDGGDKPCREVKKQLGASSLTISVSRVRRYTLIDYIQSGLQLNVVMAVDYTGSNGSCTSMSSLHNFSDVKSSPYEQAMTGVANVILPYNNRSAMAMFGFGAKVNGQNEVSHCFPMNPAADNSEVIGVQEMLNVYRTITPSIQFYGPTYFHDVIDQASKYAEQSFNFEKSQGRLSYTVLLLMTDGVVSSFQKAVAACVNASETPLSIVIVGIGSEDFGEMEALDADGTVLTTSGGKMAARDCVQFVESQQYVNNGMVAAEDLAAEVLKEIPTQMSGFMRMRNVEI